MGRHQRRRASALEFAPSLQGCAIIINNQLLSNDNFTINFSQSNSSSTLHQMLEIVEPCIDKIKDSQLSQCTSFIFHNNSRDKFLNFFIRDSINSNSSISGCCIATSSISVGEMWQFWYFISSFFLPW